MCTLRVLGAVEGIQALGQLSFLPLRTAPTRVFFVLNIMFSLRLFSFREGNNKKPRSINRSYEVLVHVKTARLESQNSLLLLRCFLVKKKTRRTKEKNILLITICNLVSGAAILLVSTSDRGLWSKPLLLSLRRKSFPIVFFILFV